MPKFELELTIWVKLHADDEDDARRLVASHREWDDWDIMDVTASRELDETE